MGKHRVRVYFRSYFPGEAHPPDGSSVAEEDRWRDEASMDFAHDSHAKWEALTVPEATEAAVRAALQKKHPKSFLILDKIAWLDETPAD